MLKLDYKSDMPLHEQITQGVRTLVIRGVLKKDDKLPSVRDLSVELTVNPNTVQRAYKTLEQEGIIYSIRGRGNFVSEIRECDQKTRETLYETLKKTVRELAFFGVDKASVTQIIEKIYEKRSELDD